MFLKLTLWGYGLQSPLKVHPNIVLHLDLGIPNGLFPVGLPDKILKALLPSSILATWHTHLTLLHIITLTILGEWYKIWSSSLWSLLHSPFTSSWAQTFSSGSYFQIPLAWIPPLMQETMFHSHIAQRTWIHGLKFSQRPILSLY